MSERAPEPPFSMLDQSKKSKIIYILEYFLPSSQGVNEKQTSENIQNQTIVPAHKTIPENPFGDFVSGYKEPTIIPSTKYSPENPLELLGEM